MAKTSNPGIALPKYHEAGIVVYVITRVAANKVVLRGVIDRTHITYTQKPDEDGDFVIQYSVAGEWRKAGEVFLNPVDAFKDS